VLSTVQPVELNVLFVEVSTAVLVTVLAVVLMVLMVVLVT